MKKNKMVTMRIIALLLLLVGLAVTTASTYLVISHAVKANSKSYTDNVAIVVEHKSKKNGLKAIVIEYNIDNKYYRVESKHYTKKPESIGGPIKIKYNSKNHEDFIWIDNNHNHKYLISGLILLGGDILIWIIINLTGKKKVDVSTPVEEKLEPPKNEKPKIEEPKVEETNDVELPAVKQTEPVVEEQKNEETKVVEDNAPLFEKEEVPAIFTPLTEEEKQNLEIEKEKKEEEIELPVIEEEKIELPVIEEPKEEPVIKEEVQKISIPEIPYDLDSPREAIVSNVMETTIAIPTLNKELIELPTKKEEKNVKINNDIKSDALTKLLEDLEKEKK